MHGQVRLRLLRSGTLPATVAWSQVVKSVARRRMADH
jgi:hypothetical protein